MGEEYSELIIVIDTSASMLGISEDKTCIDRGKDIAKEYVDSSSNGTKISIITANKETKTLLLLIFRRLSTIFKIKYIRTLHQIFLIHTEKKMLNIGLN